MRIKVALAEVPPTTRDVATAIERDTERFDSFDPNCAAKRMNPVHPPPGKKRESKHLQQPIETLSQAAHFPASTTVGQTRLALEAPFR